MNHITQRNNLEKQKANFIKFMSICPENSVLKLSQELTKIESRLEKLREYDLNKLMQPVPFQFETKQSKLNYSSLEEPLDLLTKIMNKEFLNA